MFPVRGLTAPRFEFAQVSFLTAPAGDPAVAAELIPADWNEASKSGAIETLGRRTVAVADVFAIDARAASERAFRRAGVAVDGLMIAARLGSQVPYAVAMAPDLDPGDSVCVYVTDENVGGRLSMSPFSAGPRLTIDADCNMTRVRACIARLDTALSVEPTSEMGRRIRRAIFLLARATRTHSAGEALLWAIAACEAATRGDEGRPSKERTAARINALLEVDRDGARRNALSFAELYELRSRVVHGYAVDVGEDSARLAIVFGMRVLGSLLLDPRLDGVVDPAHFKAVFRARGAEAVGVDASALVRSRLSTRHRSKRRRRHCSLG